MKNLTLTALAVSSFLTACGGGGGGTNNTSASISGTSTGTTAKGASNAVSGTLTITDPDAGQAVFKTPASFAGTYGMFTFNASTGAWTYLVDNSKAVTQALSSGQVVYDTLTVTSSDGTATQDIKIAINGTAGGNGTSSLVTNVAPATYSSSDIYAADKVALFNRLNDDRSRLLDNSSYTVYVEGKNTGSVSATNPTGWGFNGAALLLRRFFSSMNQLFDLRDLLAVYTRYKLLRPSTVRSYEDAIRCLERFTVAAAPLEDLNVEVLLSHRVWCLERMRATSYNKHRRHLRALINFALAEGHIQSQPFVKVGPAPVGVKRPKTVPSTWYKRTMAILESDSVSGLNPTKFWRLLFSVMHFTSMRRRQIVELKWEHVLLSRSALLMSSDGSKTQREWLVPVPAWISQELRELRAEIGHKSGLPVKPDDQVFCLPLLTPGRIKSPRMLDEHISRAFEALSRHLGYTVSAHRVRHTSATVMLERSGNIKAVSDMLGHADIKLTASTCVHPRLGSLRRVQQALSGLKGVIMPRQSIESANRKTLPIARRKSPPKVDYKGIFRASAAERVQLIRQRVAPDVVDMTIIDMGITKSSLYITLDFPPSTMKRKTSKDELLPTALSERMIGLQKLIGQVQTMVEESGNPKGFNAAHWIAQWLEQPLGALGGQKPAHFMDTIQGQELVSDVLARMQSGAYA
eukprot:gene11363-13215_t